jgi:hypothetical protein
MNRCSRFFRGGLILAAAFLLSHEAAATAIASVEENSFSVRPFSFSVDGVITSPPEGITVRALSPRVFGFTNVTGNATTTTTADVGAGPTPNSVFATIGATATAEPGGSAFLEHSLVVAVSIVNETGFDIDLLVMRTVFSAFNPGGPGIGAIVDDTAREFARFESSQSGPGIGDRHQCDTRLPPSSTNQTFPQPPPANACGVFSPDSSELEFGITDFASGEEEIILYTLSLTLEAASIPEPSALMVFASGLLGIVAFRWFKRRAAAIAC